MPPGSAQAEWMQSQTTFAELSKAEDGSWGVKVLKQKIWVSSMWCCVFTTSQG